MGKKQKKPFDGFVKRCARIDNWRDPEWMQIYDSAIKKLVFFWLICAPSSTYYGIFKAIAKQVADDTCIPLEEVEKILDQLEQAGEIMRDGVWIYVRPFMANQIQQYGERALQNLQDNNEGIPPKLVEAFIADKQRHESSVGGTVGATVEDTVPLNKNKGKVKVNANEEEREVEGNEIEGKTTTNDPVVVFSETSFPQTTEGCIQNNLDIPPVSYEKENELIGRIAKGFSAAFGWQGDPFAANYLPKFMTAAQKILALQPENQIYQNRFIYLLMEALIGWGKDKRIAPGHLGSDYVWDTLLPGQIKEQHFSLAEMGSSSADNFFKYYVYVEEPEYGPINDK
ncbi:hypothetical protein KA005_01830 [bacterium]|nr:hypothetical protein [bacterium]